MFSHTPFAPVTFRLVGVLTFGFLLGACSTQPKPPVEQIKPTSRFTAQAQLLASQRPWWETALHTGLQADIERVLADNPQIRFAATSVAVARARLDSTEAQRWIDIGVNASGQLRDTDGERDFISTLGLDAQLPLDVFGRLRASADAASFELVQALAQLEQVRLEQVQAYLLSAIDAAEAAQLLQLLGEQLETASTLLELTELRFSQGLASSVDVLQQRQQLAALRRQEPAAQQTLREAINRAEGLLGDSPPVVLRSMTLAAVDPRVATVTPADLLQRRPDLVAQRAALMAADKRYTAELRARLPEASLSASALLRSVSGDQTAILSAAIEATASLIDSGRQQALIDQRAALLQQAGTQYLQTWLDALVDTDNLFNKVQHNQQQLHLSAQALQASRELFAAARFRYERGVGDYLPVLAALGALQQQQRDLLALQTEQQRTLVRLHTALGLPRALLAADQDVAS